MARKSTARRRARIALMSDGNPRSLSTLGLRFFEALRARGLAESTVRNREVSLWRFASWCGSKGVAEVGDVTRPIVEAYQTHLFYYRDDDGNPLTTRVQHNHLAHLKAFFKWLARQNLVLHNAAADLELPKVPRRLPRTVLTKEEAEAVLAQPDVKHPLGIRDRAILETLYSTGMRRLEVARLSIYDVDRARGTVFIQEGKGKRDRVVPIGDRALLWIQKYLDDVRPQLVVPPDAGTLFLGNRGEPFWVDHLSTRVARYVEQANLNKRGGCHVFRHTAATLMLENGADVRFIQAMLGHSALSTTEIYTRVSIQKLKEIHTATHPTGKLLNDVNELIETLDEESAADPE